MKTWIPPHYWPFGVLAIAIASIAFLGIGYISYLSLREKSKSTQLFGAVGMGLLAAFIPMFLGALIGNKMHADETAISLQKWVNKEYGLAITKNQAINLVPKQGSTANYVPVNFGNQKVIVIMKAYENGYALSSPASARPYLLQIQPKKVTPTAPVTPTPTPTYKVK